MTGGSAPAPLPVPVIGLAHGSRHPAGTRAIERLMATVGALGGMPSHQAYLDLAEPDLLAVTSALGAAGHRRAVVVPLLFTEAFHATVDVPAAAREAAAATGVDLAVSEILGTGDDILDVLLAGLGPDDRSASALVFAVGSSHAAANDAVIDLAARLSLRLGIPARAAFGTCEPRLDAVLPDLPAPVALLPLFFADGLLLGPLRSLADQRGWTMAEPMGELAADLVLARYASVLGADPADARERGVGGVS